VDAAVDFEAAFDQQFIAGEDFARPLPARKRGSRAMLIRPCLSGRGFAIAIADLRFIRKSSVSRRGLPRGAGDAFGTPLD